MKPKVIRDFLPDSRTGNSLMLFVFTFGILSWSAFVLYFTWTNNVNFPAYGDVFRFIEEFLIPLQEGKESFVKLVFQEYQPLGHGHVLTRITIALSNIFLNLDFRMFWIFGLIGYFGTLLTSSFTNLRRIQKR